jgi:arabinosyltransferase
MSCAVYRMCNTFAVGISWMRHTVACSGLFYMKPSQASLDTLRLVFDRIANEHGWDQALFNEVIFFPSRPGYVSPCPTRRIMDRHLFLNSKTLFVHLRKDRELYRTVQPAMVHLNYHMDKFQRLQAVAKRYIDGDMAALDAFPDASG